MRTSWSRRVVGVFLTLLCGLTLLPGIRNAAAQAPATDAAQATTNAPADATQVPEFWRVPALNALVILGSNTNINPAGVSNVSRLVIRDDLPLLRRPEFRKVVAPYLWQPMTEVRMKNLQQDIILYYRNHDHPLVDVFYPEQVVDNGNLQVVVLEGKLKNVRLQDTQNHPYTNGYTPPSYVRQGISLKEGGPILESRVNSDLDWLNRNPFRKVDAVYKQGADFGESDLVLKVDDQWPFRVFAGYEDSGSRIVGEDRVLAGLTWGKAFGFTDNQFTYQFMGNPGFDQLRAHTASYSVPLPWRHVVRVFGSYVDVKGDVANGVTLQGNSYQTSIRYEVPLPFIEKYQHEFSLGWDYKFSQNSLFFGVPTTVNEPTEVMQAALGYNGVLPDPWGQTSVGAQLFYSPGGLSGKNTDSSFHAYRNATANYFYGRLSGERATKLPLSPDFQLRGINECFSWDIRGSVQASDANLIPSEQLGLGGYATARGYEEREANEDQGWLISNELRTPAFSLLKFVGQSHLHDRLQLLAFWDYGVGYPKHPFGTEARHTTFNSVGPGLRYVITRYLSLRFDYGWQLKASGQDNDSITHKPLQDSRGHLGVQISF